MIRFKFTDATVRDFQVEPGAARVEIYDEDIKQLCCRISSTGKKVFQVIARINGRTNRVAIGVFPVIGVKEARNNARAALVALASGVDLNAAKAEKRRRGGTLSEMFEHLITTKSLAPNTVYGYRLAIQNHLSQWKDKPLSALSRDNVLDWYKRIKANAGPYAANRAADLLSAICNHARIVSGKPEVNPVQIIRDSQVRFKEAPRDDCLSFEEVQTFLSLLPAMPGMHNADIMFLLLLTGMRKSEGMGLLWQHIDFKVKTLLIPHTKNGKPLLIPLPDQVYMMLSTRWETWNRPQSGPVFPTNSKAGHAANIDQASRHIKMELPHFTPHVLRKTFATAALNIGIDSIVVDRLTNHIPRGMTAKHYYKPGIEDLRKHIQRIADALTGNSRPE